MHGNEGNVLSGKGHGNFRAPIHTSAKRYVETYTQITCRRNTEISMYLLSQCASEH